MLRHIAAGAQRGHSEWYLADTCAQAPCIHSLGAQHMHVTKHTHVLCLALSTHHPPGTRRGLAIRPHPGSHAAAPAHGLAHAGTQRGQRRAQDAESPRAGLCGSFIGFKKRKISLARRPRVPVPRRWPAGQRSRWLQWRLVQAILWKTEDHVTPPPPKSSPGLPFFTSHPPPSPLPVLPRSYLRPGPPWQEGCCPLVLEQRWGTEGQRQQIPDCGLCSPGDLHQRAIQ